MALELSFDEAAEAIIQETIGRGYARHESIATLSTGIQESGLRMVWSPNGLWYGYYQQDENYPNRMDPMGNIVGFLDRLDLKRHSPGASPDIWKNIFWVQQRPSELTAEQAYQNGRQAYLIEIQRHIIQANELYDRLSGGPQLGWTGDPVWLADVLRAEGLNVIEHDGWRNRGHGDFKDIRGIICHHTAGGGPNDWQIVQNGRSDLPGPLAQLVLERDGTYRVIAAGVCWHAGRGSWPSWPTDNANWHTIGIEAVNNGIGQSWPAVQLDAYKRGCAAIARRVGFGANMVAGHKEYSSEGKIDPAGIDMRLFRDDVHALLSGPKANAIDEAYVAAPWLGKRLTPELPTPDGRGRFASFENGHIYWTAQTGARPIPKLLFEVYAKLGYEAGPLGYPTRFFTVIPNVGDIQAFEGGVLYRRYDASDGFYVHGKIGDRYAVQGFEAGALGWPTSNEIQFDNGVYQDFENGRVIFSPGGVVAVKHPAHIIPS